MYFVYVRRMGEVGRRYWDDHFISTNVVKVFYFVLGVENLEEGGEYTSMSGILLVRSSLIYICLLWVGVFCRK